VGLHWVTVVSGEGKERGLRGRKHKQHRTRAARAHFYAVGLATPISKQREEEKKKMPTKTAERQILRASKKGGYPTLILTLRRRKSR